MEPKVAGTIIQELRSLIRTIVGQRVRLPHPMPYKQQGDRPVEEVLEEMRQIRIVPKPGAPSVVEMLREDRDR